MAYIIQVDLEEITKERSHTILDMKVLLKVEEEQGTQSGLVN